MGRRAPSQTFHSSKVTNVNFKRGLLAILKRKGVCYRLQPGGEVGRVSASADVIQSVMTAEFQVSPSPKPTSRTLSPGLQRPARKASSSAIGTPTAEVLPYFERFTTPSGSRSTP